MDSTALYAMITFYNWIEAGGFESRHKVLALSMFMSSLMIYFYLYFQFKNVNYCTVLSEKIQDK